jgi:hypothetical protein
MRKDMMGSSCVASIAAHGTSALNIDSTRIHTSDVLNGGAYAERGTPRHDGTENWRYKRDGGAGVFVQPQGRFPANIVHTGDLGVVAGFPDTGISSGGRVGNATGIYANQGRTGWGTEHHVGDPGFGDSGSSARFFQAVKV